jgi:type I restriction enzyme S subunit
VKFTTDPKKYADEGSVLFSVRAPVGDVNVANQQYCIGRGLASVSMKQGDNLFLYYYLDYLKPHFIAEGTGSTFKAINKSKMENFMISFPASHVQLQVKDILSSLDNKIIQENAKKQGLDALFKSMLKDLMTAKVRVKDLSFEN